MLELASGKNKKKILECIKNSMRFAEDFLIAYGHPKYDRRCLQDLVLPSNFNYKNLIFCCFETRD